MEPDNLTESNAAYRLGRDRLTLRMWQELAWTWDVSDEDVIQSVEISLDDLLHWLDQLKDAIDPLAAIDIKLWTSRFALKWSAYYGSEEHSRDVPEGIVVPTGELLARNPFHHDLQDLLRITDKADLFRSGRSDLVRWFTIGSIVGRCEYLVWADWSVEDDALAILSQAQEFPAQLRQEALTVGSSTPTLRLNALRRLHQSVMNLISGGTDDPDPQKYALVLITNPTTVFFLGNRITTQLVPYEFRLLRAFADQPGKPLAWQELANLIGTETNENNLRRYVSRLLQKIAKDSCSPDEYKSFRKRLKDEFFPTDEKTGYYLLNLEPKQVAVMGQLPKGR